MWILEYECHQYMLRIFLPTGALLIRYLVSDHPNHGILLEQNRPRRFETSSSSTLQYAHRLLASPLMSCNLQGYILFLLCSQSSLDYC